MLEGTPLVALVSSQLIKTKLPRDCDVAQSLGSRVFGYCLYLISFWVVVPSAVVTTAT